VKAITLDGNASNLNLPDFQILPRAIAIDLDGTLLDGQTRISEPNCVALEKCIFHGIPVIIATSRPARIFDRIFPKDLAKNCSLVIMNGAVAKGNPPLSGYFKEMLSEPIVRGIIKLALEFSPQTRITMELDGYEFGANWSADPATLWERNSATPDMLLPLEAAMRKHPSKIALGGLGMDILKLAENISLQFKEKASVVRAMLGNPLLNITSMQATKPNALKRLLTPLGISLSEVLAFGDDVPDIGMLRECGISVAVANALPEVKSVCAFQTASNDDNGVAMVLERMLVEKKDDG
jgi:Cof subfamily protein (haloacid dehalogenase superfamily)